MMVLIKKVIPYQAQTIATMNQYSIQDCYSRMEKILEGFLNSRGEPWGNMSFHVWGN
jgi:hypothetical protein